MSYLLNSETSGSNQPYGYQPSQQSYGYQPSQQSSYGGYQPSQQQSYGGGYQPSQPQQQSYGYVPQQQQQQAYQQPPAYNPSYQPQQQQHQQQSYTPSYQQYQQQQQRQPQQQAYHQPPPASGTSSMASSAPVAKSPGDISLTVVGTRPSGAQTTVKLEVDPNDTTLGDITEMIADEIGILPERQLIKYKNKNLDSRTLTLKKLKMPDNSQLAVSVKPPKQQTQATAGAAGHRPIGQQQQNQQAGAGNAGYRAEFDKMDTDRSGYIDEKELRRVFMGWAPNSLIKKAMAMADTNRDGKISFDEYCVIRTKLGGGKK